MVEFHDRFLTLYTEAQKTGMKRSEFASKCGASENQIQGWLRGTSEPSPKFLGKIAVGLEINLYWLLGLSEVRDSSIVKIQSSLQNLTKQQTALVKIFIQFVKYLERNKNSSSNLM